MAPVELQGPESWEVLVRIATDPYGHPIERVLSGHELVDWSACPLAKAYGVPGGHP